ncbi:methyltransferase domain-containing protein [Chitinimonas sp. BJYL2]|uniref:methyltransferase domain-containing protein n=1 Tax=Chitinimonas sp. BJYL2 TaxID=2976696 RepID=UPI0022B2BC32|nr:methyltransferase domain-containing protein [Chitinimonas sp. BJYL2]
MQTPNQDAGNPVDPGMAAKGFAGWLNSPLGEYLIAREHAFFDQAVADVFGYYAVQIELCGHDLLASNRMPTRLKVGASASCALQCDPAALPFPAASIDLLLLPHTLDFHADPHAVLREAERVLVPEGRLLLSGFNPWSVWGACRLAKRRQGYPWRGNFLSPNRIRDWMALLGFEAGQSKLDCHALPFEHSHWRERLRLVETASARWLPIAGGVYCLEGIKRVRGMRLLSPAWKQHKQVRRPVAVALPDRQDAHEPE